MIALVEYGDLKEHGKNYALLFLYIYILFGEPNTEVMTMDGMLLCVTGFFAIIYVMRHDRKENEKKFNKNKSVGDIGENIVAKRLNTLDDNYIVKNDVWIGNCQIDHMVMCIDSSDIFVIETKMWGGIISGSYSDRMWCQDKNGEIRYLDNPIKQNRHHCRIVRNNYPGYEVHNIVVFVRNNNVPKSSCIIGVNQLVDYIYKTTNKEYNRGVIGL